jgi:plasmid maintenance system antidote protein VapI
MLNSSTTTDTVIVDAAEKIPPDHPGEILPEDFMKEFGLSQNRVARDLRVLPRRINGIVHGKRPARRRTGIDHPYTRP